MEKLRSYQGFSGQFSEWKSNARAKYDNWKEDHGNESLVDIGGNLAKNSSGNESENDYSHIYRRKTRLELIKLSLSVCGIELAYASETAFVSPTLLKIGVNHRHMSMVWALSPIIGFFVTPILGSVSDRCHMRMGRRRPFIILLSIGVFIGLLLVPNGEYFGYYFGDYYKLINSTSSVNETTSAEILDAPDEDINEMLKTEDSSHTWGIFFTVLGTVLLDFDADACQSPSRAYLIDVCLPEDHARGLSTFTIMAGLGGAIGYSLGGINWDATRIGVMLGGHVRAVFTLITIIFVFCVSATVTSFKEVPLGMLDAMKSLGGGTTYGTIDEEKDGIENAGYSSVPGENAPNMSETSFMSHSSNEMNPINIAEEPAPSLRHYLKSILFMPVSIRMVCITNLFCWMAHVCYSLYFTDFVGEAVFGGDPKAVFNSPKFNAYEEGVRFGCFGMAMYSLSCACYSLIIEKLIARYGAKRVYICGLLFYSGCMTLMALTRHKVSVIVFSWGAGVMYSTLFTMPYLLIANYHSKCVFELSETGEPKYSAENNRGIGTDVAIVSSMVFLAQFILSCMMGQIISMTESTTAVVSVAAVLSFLGALSATQIMYLDL